MIDQGERLVSTRIVLLTPAKQDVFRILGNTHWNLGPVLQGVLMGCVPKEYGELLHQAPFNPYSQYCVIENNNLVWVLNTVNSYAFSNIVEPLLKSDNIKMKKYDLPISFGQSTQLQYPFKDLLSEVHKGEQCRFTLEFVTPTAFKSKGAYQNLPNLQLIYQNLLMHYTSVFEASNSSDPETIDFLVKNTRIVKYNIKSQFYSLDGKKIPAFMGNITVEVKGPDTLVGLARMLFKFATFSGIGIKTAMGMGGVIVK